MTSEKIIFFVKVAIFLLFNSLGLIILKSHVNKNHFEDFYQLLITLINPYLIIGLIFYGFGFFVWMDILQSTKLSIAYPIVVTLSVIIIFVLSNQILRESISLLTILGLLFCVIGIGVMCNEI